jgi:hypothetical protein
MQFYRNEISRHIKIAEPVTQIGADGWRTDWKPECAEVG